jgi:uncharacterized membrane protein (UPF0127 family)
MTFRTEPRALFIVAGLTVAAASAAASAQAAARCPAPIETPNPAPLAVHAPAAVLELRVADTVQKREYGLMCVRDLPPASGMIFVFNDGDNQRAFWMKNTLIPLDMVFVMKSGRVNNVDANVPATRLGTPDDQLQNQYGTGSYVIELNAGEAQRAGIKPGTALDLSAVGPAKD